MKDPNKTFKRLLNGLDAPEKINDPEQAKLRLLSGLRGLVARTKGNT